MLIPLLGKNLSDMKNNLLWWYEIFLRQGASIRRWAKLEKVTEEEMEFLKPNTYLISTLQINLRNKAYFKKLTEKYPS